MITAAAKQKQPDDLRAPLTRAQLTHLLATLLLATEGLGAVEAAAAEEGSATTSESLGSLLSSNLVPLLSTVADLLREVAKDKGKRISEPRLGAFPSGSAEGGISDQASDEQKAKAALRIFELRYGKLPAAALEATSKAGPLGGGSTLTSASAEGTAETEADLALEEAARRQRQILAALRQRQQEAGTDDDGRRKRQRLDDGAAKADMPSAAPNVDLGGGSSRRRWHAVPRCEWSSCAIGCLPCPFDPAGRRL